MKYFKTLLILIIASNFSFSQKYVDLEIEYTNPTLDTITGTSFSYGVEIKNKSDSTVPGMTRLIFWFNINDSIYALDGTINRKSILAFGGPIYSNSSIFFPYTFNFSGINNALEYNKVCFHYEFDSVFVDTITTNNFDCFIFKYSNFSSITDNNIKDGFAITNSYLTINIQNKLNENYQYQLFSINGKLLENKKSFEDEIIDVSSFKKGLYILKITNSKSSFSKKIMLH